jgi:hypothetical protein
MAAAGVFISTYKNISISVWNGSSTLLDIERVRQQCRTLVEATPSRRFGSLVVVHSVTNTPTDEAVNRAALNLRDEFSENIIGEAQLIEPKGLLAMAARFALRAYRLLRPPSYPCEVFDSTKEALAWISPLVGVPPHEILSALEKVKREAGLSLETSGR